MRIVDWFRRLGCRTLKVGTLFPNSIDAHLEIQNAKVGVSYDAHQLSCQFKANPNTGFVTNFPLNAILVYQERPR